MTLFGEQRPRFLKSQLCWRASIIIHVPGFPKNHMLRPQESWHSLAGICPHTHTIDPGVFTSKTLPRTSYIHLLAIIQQVGAIMNQLFISYWPLLSNYSPAIFTSSPTHHLPITYLSPTHRPRCLELSGRTGRRASDLGPLTHPPQPEVGAVSSG